MKEKTFERKEELIKAALKEFTAKKYEDASLNGIIKNAGISKGTFYYHFKDKQDLYLFLLEFSVNAKWKFVNDWMKEHPEKCDTKDIFGKFKLQARIAAEFAVAFPEYHILGRMFSKEKGSKIYEVAIQALGSGSDALLEEMLDMALREGDFREDFSRHFVIRMISFLFMHFDDIFDSEEDNELGRMVENLDSFVDFLRYGLGK